MPICFVVLQIITNMPWLRAHQGGGVNNVLFGSLLMKYYL